MLYFFLLLFISGAVITAYRVRNGKYTLIGRGDPQRAQVFFHSFLNVKITLKLHWQ